MIVSYGTLRYAPTYMDPLAASIGFTRDHRTRISNLRTLTLVQGLIKVRNLLHVFVVNSLLNRRPNANYRTGLSHLQSTHNWSRGTLVLGMGSRLWLAPRLLGGRAAKPVLKSL